MPQGIKLDETVLSVEELTRLRRDEGLSFGAIGKRIGYSGGAVGAYARRVLPPELCGRRKGKKKTKATAKDPQARLEQIKAELEAARKKGETRALAALKQKHEREEEKKRSQVTAVRERIEEDHGDHDDHVMAVTAAFEAVKIAPLPNLQEGLFIAAGANGTAAAMVTGPGGLQDMLAQQQSHVAWREFLAGIAPNGELDGLVGMTPPRYVRTDVDRWEHLRQIAAGGKVVSAVLRTSPLRSPELNNSFIADWLIILEPELWIPVSSALPPGADYYLVAWSCEGRQLTGEGWYDVHHGWTFPVYADDKGDIGEEFPSVTHWAPMPAAPKLGGG